MPKWGFMGCKQKLDDDIIIISAVVGRHRERDREDQAD